MVASTGAEYASQSGGLAYQAIDLVKSNWYLILGAYLAARTFYLIFLHPLSKYPGPFFAKFTDTWKTQATARHVFKTKLRELHAKHGDVVRIGPNEVSIIAPADVRDMYGHKSAFLKGPFYNAWAIGAAENHFSERGPQAHANRRRAVAGAYALNHLVTLEHYIDEHMDALFDHFDKAAQSAEKIDLSEYITWFAYDSVAKISFGEDYGLLRNHGDPNGTLKIFAEATTIVSTAATWHSMGWMLPTRISTWMAEMALGDKGPAFFTRTAEKFVTRREKIKREDPAHYHAEENKDMVYRFLEAKDSATGKSLAHYGVVIESVVIVVAGADTTLTSVNAFLRYIYANPECLAKMRQEIEEARANGDFDMPPSYAQAAKLDYTQAAIKEAMRLHPAVGMTLQRVVPEGGRVLGGQYFPAGTLVGQSAWEVHYDERAFGKDAKEFRPERWLEGDRNELERYNLTFGAGSRVCLGKNISMMEMSKLLPAIVHKYDADFVNPAAPYKVTEHWFTPQHEFMVQLKQRAH